MINPKSEIRKNENRKTKDESLRECEFCLLSFEWGVGEKDGMVVFFW